MKVSLNWISEYVDLAGIAPDELAAKLTMAGFEVEGTERIASLLDDVVVAEVLRAEAHPGAHRLTRVWISDGHREAHVLCGAPNVPSPGGRVAWARPGAKLPDGRTLEARTIAGLPSEGMLCSEAELGLSDETNGILTLAANEGALGVSIAEALLAKDTVFEINVTPNRPDCMGHIGVAREIAALTGRPLRFPTGADRADSMNRSWRIEVEEASLCPRYVARVIEGVRVGPSPRWLMQRLRSVGIRPISNVVDVTNYVMLEYGQPLHAFDAGRLAGSVIGVRRALQTERILTLDEVERCLDPGDLIITDGRGPIALAGVMGGLASEVTSATTHVLLEVACFRPDLVRRTSRRLGLRSEASQRFERGVDVMAIEAVSLRAAQLIADIAGGTIREQVDWFPAQPVAREISLDPRYVARLLGIELDSKAISDYLNALGIKPVGDAAFVIPSHRGDLTRPADLVEEVARLHGFESIPARLPITSDTLLGEVTPREPRMEERVRDTLVHAGMDEVLTLGFASPSRLEWFGDDAFVRIQNPLREEQSVLRTRLLANLLGVLAFNLDRGASDLQIFEVGTVFQPAPNGLESEFMHVAGVIAGGRREGLSGLAMHDFFTLKGLVDTLGARLGCDVVCRANPGIPWIHPGVAASSTGDLVGHFGEIHPTLRLRFGIEIPVFGFEFDLSTVPAREPKKMQPLPRFPAASRDLSLLIAETVPAHRIFTEIRSAGGAILTEAQVLEDYRDRERVPVGQKAMLWSLTFRASDRTLTDSEIAAVEAKILAALETTYGAKRR